MLEAGRLLCDERVVRLAEQICQRLPLRWPNNDICHGVAGAGMTQLRFFEITGTPDYLDRAVRAADSIARAAQHHDGMLMWPIPRDFPSQLAGARQFGFAHGVAGVGAFLLAAGQATGDRRYLDLAVEAAATLASAADVERGAAYWPTASGGRRRTHWCSGSSGVGSFLLRAWQHAGDPRLRELVTQAATAVYRARWQVGPAQCHGLAGDGDFLLDLAHGLAADRYRRWSEELAACIYVRHTIRHGRLLAPDETGTAVVPDYGVGLAGVLAFLLRLRHGGPRMWVPESFVDRQSGEFGDTSGEHAPIRGRPSAAAEAAVGQAAVGEATAESARGGDTHGDRHRRPADVAGGRA